MADRYCICGHLYSVHNDFTVWADTACTVDDPEGRWACWCDEFKPAKVPINTENVGGIAIISGPPVLRIHGPSGSAANAQPSFSIGWDEYASSGPECPDWTCESCGADANVELPDGSHWCHACDTAAKNLGYDDLEVVEG